MQRTNKPRKELAILRKEMEANAQSYNKYLTARHLRACTDHELLRFTHPGDRPGFASKLQQEGRITENQAKKFTRI